MPSAVQTTKDPFKIDVSMRIRAAMTEMGIKNAAALAIAIGKEDSQVRNWCNGTSIPMITDGLPLARFFGVTTDWLYGGIDTGLTHAKYIRLSAILAGETPPELPR